MRDGCTRRRYGRGPVIILTSLVTLLAVLAGCSSSTDADPTPTPAPPTPTVLSPTVEPTAAPTPVPSATPAPTPTPAASPEPMHAVAYRTELSIALQEHSYLLAEAAYAHVRGRDPEAVAAREILRQENTPLIRDLVSMGLSLRSGDAFTSAWHEWTLTVLDYANALHVENDQLAGEIWRSRVALAASISSPLSELDHVDQAVLRGGIEQHVELTLAMVRNMHEKPAIDGYWSAWYNTEFLGPLADQLSEAVVRQVPASFADSGDALTSQTGAAALEAELFLALHEYGMLLMNTSAAIVDGRTDSEVVAARDTLDARNTIPLSQLIGFFSSEHEAEFLELWRQHIYAVLGFARA
ncbi:MAG: hypothetical protein WD533_03380, partial [Dehalococcoidia bacterium]